MIEDRAAFIARWNDFVRSAKQLVVKLDEDYRDTKKAKREAEKTKKPRRKRAPAAPP
jgi:hypothetical protein